MFGRTLRLRSRMFDARDGSGCRRRDAGRTMCAYGRARGTFVPRLIGVPASAMLTVPAMFSPFAPMFGLAFTRFVTRRFADPGNALPDQFFDRND